MPVDPKFWQRLKRLDDILRARNRAEQQVGIDRTKPIVNPESIADAAAEPDIGVGIEKIMANAMRTRTMLHIVYKNEKRLVEPYKVESASNSNAAAKPYNNKVGVNPLQYMGSNRILWAFDRTTIKAFIVGRIQEIEQTNIEFSPRWPIEGIKP